MKKKLLTTAVLASIAGTAGAVNVNPDGLGQVGLFPYYTVQSGNSTLIYITNTTSNGKVVKVRILEGKNSREVLDFNLYLSKNDIWTAAIVQDGTTGAKIFTTDKTCTVPVIPAAGVAFRNFEYTGSNADGEDTTLARTREGHIEVIEMGTMNADEAGTASATSRSPFRPNDWATHVSGVPLSCANLNGAWGSGAEWTTLATRALTVNSGGLYAGAFIINGAAGTGNAFNATMLDSFNSGPAATVLHTAPGTTTPNLTQAIGPTGAAPESIVFSNGVAFTNSWAATTPSAGLNAVTATLMHLDVMNEYSVETGLSAATDWVLTHPTKRDYVRYTATAAGQTQATRPPFTTIFGAGGSRPGTGVGLANPITMTFPATTGGACELVSLALWDREERTPVSSVDFSPQPLGGSNSLCWETNVITFNNTNALGSDKLKLNVNIPTDFPEKNGWMRLTFSDVNQKISTAVPTVRTYYGLPVIGFAVENFVNNNVTAGVLANYGVLFDHRTTRSITTP